MKHDIITAAFCFFINNLRSYVCELTGLSRIELCYAHISRDTLAGQVEASYIRLLGLRTELAPNASERECMAWFDSLID